MLIYHYKTTDEKDILQSEYGVGNEGTLGNEDKDETLHVNSLEKCNNILMKLDKKDVGLDNFVKKIITVEPVKPFPTKRQPNLCDPALRYKGVKKENVSII